MILESSIYNPKRPNDHQYPKLLTCLLEHDLSTETFIQKHQNLNSNYLLIKKNRDVFKGGICDTCLLSRDMVYSEKVLGSDKLEDKNGTPNRRMSIRSGRGVEFLK
jgi:hypothetical protein